MAKENRLYTINKILNLFNKGEERAMAAIVLDDVIKAYKNGYNEKHMAAIIRVCLLQNITRKNNKRSVAFSLFLELLSSLGKNKADAFFNHINEVEARLNKEGRSFLQNL